jgi:hypothetical protein
MYVRKFVFGNTYFKIRDLLELEKHMISQLGNCLAIIAITFLISYVDEYLESKTNSLLASEV